MEQNKESLLESDRYFMSLQFIYLLLPFFVPLGNCGEEDFGKDISEISNWNA